MSIGKINTIEELVKALDYEADYDSYSGLIKSLNISPASVKKYCSWNKDN